MDKNNGGPAFPAKRIVDSRLAAAGTAYEQGITTRDYFAAQALQALIVAGRTSDQTVAMPYYSNGGAIDRSPYTRTAYQYADSMLRAREQ